MMFVYLYSFFCWNKLAYNRTSAEKGNPRKTFGQHVKEFVIYTIYTVSNNKYLFIFRRSRKSEVMDHFKAATNGHFGVLISNWTLQSASTRSLLFCVCQHRVEKMSSLLCGVSQFDLISTWRLILTIFTFYDLYDSSRCFVVVVIILRGYFPQNILPLWIIWKIQGENLWSKRPYYNYVTKKKRHKFNKHNQCLEKHFVTGRRRINC